MKKKTVIMEVAFGVELEPDVDPNDVTFDIPIEQVKPMVGGKVVGSLKGYTTQEFFE